MNFSWKLNLFTSSMSLLLTLWLIQSAYVAPTSIFCVTWLQFQNQESGGSFLCVRGPGAFNQPKIDTMSQLASPLSTHSYHFTKKNLCRYEWLCNVSRPHLCSAWFSCLFWRHCVSCLSLSIFFKFWGVICQGLEGSIKLLFAPWKWKCYWTHVMLLHSTLWLPTVKPCKAFCT